MTVRYCGPAGLGPLCEAADIRYFDRAVELSLHGSRCTDAMVAPICALDSLQTLSLSGTSISKAGLEQIRSSLPDCRISNGDIGPQK